MNEALTETTVTKQPTAQKRLDVESFWKGAIFMPHDQFSRIEALIEQVWRSRQSAFLAFGLKVASAHPKLYNETSFGRCFELFKSMPPARRRQLVEFPPFLIWLKQSISLISDPTILEHKLNECGRVINVFKERGNNPHILKMQDLIIEVERFHIDPLISEVAFPEYKLPDENRQVEFEEKALYPYSFFVESLALALERIKQSWPEAYSAFPKFVKIVVDMIDGEVTSYSAADHTGVIFVSTDNSPLVALEEYLMHEFGHQILYHVMELDPLVLMENKRTFKMPWSGNERDFYGYFHAFFIYILLARYLERVTGRSQREQRRVTARSSHIIKGLMHAITDLESADDFTPRGRHLFENLKAEVYHLTRAAEFATG